MSFGFPKLLCSLLPLWTAVAQERELRVCADPDSLPFSNEKEEGFENKIVRIVADELHASVRYMWWPQGGWSVQSNLKTGLCDVVPGVLSGMGTLRTTAPYYRSTYVFVTRAASPTIVSLDDPALRKARIGMPLASENSPMARALLRRGVAENVRRFPVSGQDARPNPTASIVQAVATGEIDVGVVWGPLGGYFAMLQPWPLKIRTVLPQLEGEALPMIFEISMGVPKEKEELRSEIDRALRVRRDEIEAVLARFNVPRLDPPSNRRER